MYTPGKYTKTRGFLMFSGVHERNIGLNWAKQLRNVLIQLQWKPLLRHLRKRTLISKKEQDLQLITLLRNEFLQKRISRTFCQKIFSLRNTSKWLFSRHYNNLKITVRIITSSWFVLCSHYVLKRTSALAHCHKHVNNMFWKDE